MTSLTAPAPGLPIDQLVDQFARLVDSMRVNPSSEMLRQLELLGQQIMARTRELGPAALLILQRAGTALIGILTAPATVIIVGTTVGTLAFWWLFLQLMQSAMSGVPDYGKIAKDVAASLAVSLSTLGVPLDEKCITALANSIEELLEDLGPAYPIDYLDGYIDELIRLYLKCIYGDIRMDDLFEDAEDLINYLIELIKDLMKNGGFGRGFGLMLGGLLLGGASAEAGQGLRDRDQKKLREISKRLGLKGIPRGDGFGMEETPEETEWPPCEEQEELAHEDVDVDVETPLGAFSKEELEKRKEALGRWRRDLEKEIEDDRKELKKLEANPDNDTRRADLLRLRIEMNSREVERLRRAEQNTDRECQLREIRKTG